MYRGLEDLYLITIRKLKAVGQPQLAVESLLEGEAVRVVADKRPHVVRDVVAHVEVAVAAIAVDAQAD